MAGFGYSLSSVLHPFFFFFFHTRLEVHFKIMILLSFYSHASFSLSLLQQSYRIGNPCSVWCSVALYLSMALCMVIGGLHAEDMEVFSLVITRLFQYACNTFLLLRCYLDSLGNTACICLASSHPPLREQTYLHKNGGRDFPWNLVQLVIQ